jgi:glycosyltransferase involved in cell wall biosynthesis
MSIRILQICASLSKGGGVQNVLKNYYAHMGHENYIFDFVVMGAEVGELEEWFESKGSHIYHVTPRSVSFKKNTGELKQIIKNGNYDVVHCHQGYKSLVAIIIAKIYGVKTRIVHCHQAFPKESAPKRIIRRLSTLLIKCLANVLIGCGEDAAKWLYGERMLKSGKAIVLNNAIDLERYAFSNEKGNQIRSELGLENKLIIGNVARITEVKNHKLLIDVFATFHQQNEQSALLLVGDGELMDETRDYCKTLGLSESVIFMGARSDIYDMLSVMDVFVLTSKSEGLALVLVEAQANGLPVVCSPFVTREAGIQSNVLFVAENDYENTEAWCSAIEKAIDIGRLEDITAIAQAGFDIRQEAKKLEKIYNKKGLQTI